MKLITRLLLGLIAVVATLFIAAAFIVSTIDPAQHKDRIQQFVFDQTGRTLEIRGRVEAQLFPWAGFSLRDVTLSGAEGFFTENFAQIRQVDARLRFLPLIVGSVSIRHVHLQGLELDLQRNLEGRTNWDDLMSNTSVVTTDVSNDDVLQEIEAGTPVVAALSVGQLVVSDSIVHWRDEMADKKFLLSDFRLSAGEVTLTEPFRFDTGFVVNGVAGFPITQLSASGLAGIDLAENIYRVDSFQVDSVLTFASNDSPADASSIETEAGKSPEQEIADPKLTARYTGSVVADLSAQRVDFSPLTLAVEGVVLSGELHMTDLLQNPGVFGHIASDASDVATLLETRGVVLPDTFDRTLLQDFKLSANFQRADENFLISDVSLGNQHAALTGNFQIANFQRAPVLTGTITSNNINPALWADAIGYTPFDKTALTKAHISADVRQSGQLLVLNDIALKLDDSTVSGDIELVKTDDGQYPVRFELQADSLNFDRYFRGGIDIDGLAALADRADLDLPVETIRALDIQGKLTAAQLQWSGMQFTEVALPIRVAEGRVEGLEIKATTYKGTLFTSTVLDVTPDEPLLTATVSLNAVDLNPMLDAALQGEAALSGTGIVNVDLLSRGSTVAEMADRAGGALNVRITDGAIDNVNLAHEWVTLLSAYLLPETNDQTVVEAEPGQSSERNAASGASPGSTALTANQKTLINELSMSWELADGRLYSNDLDLRSVGMNLSGQGSIALAEQSIDYLLQVAFTEDAVDAAADTIDSVLAPTHNRMVGMTVPLVIRGSVKPLLIDFIARLNESLQAELQKPDIFGSTISDSETTGADVSTDTPLDIAVVKDRLLQHNAEAETALNARLEAVRDAEQQQQNRVTPVEEDVEASNSINEQIQRETDELKNRLQNNLQKDLQRKLSNLTED